MTGLLNHSKSLVCCGLYVVRVYVISETNIHDTRKKKKTNFLHE